MQIRTDAAITTGVCVLLFGFIVGFFVNEYFSQFRAVCPIDDQVKSEGDALEFAKYWIRRDKEYWKYFGITDEKELNLELRKENCCSAEQIDPEKYEGRQWHVALNSEKRGVYEFSYYLDFDACRLKISRESLARKY